MNKKKIKLSTLFLMIILLISGGFTQQSSQTTYTSPNVWQKTFGGSSYDVACSVQQTKDGGYIVAGWTESFGARGDMYILKLDANGKLVWQKTYGGSDYDEAYSVQQTQDGGYIVAGWTSSFGEGGDVYIIKLDANGNLVWQKNFGGRGDDRGYSVKQTKDGGYIVAGETSSFGSGESDVYILKFDSYGNLVWQKNFGGGVYEAAYSIQQTSDGGYIVAGYKYPFGTEGSVVYILKLDTNGKLVWEKTFRGGSEAYSIQQTKDGGYIAAGYTQSFATGKYTDVYILKLNANGDLVWEKTFGGKYNDEAYSIQQTKDGGYIAAGWTLSFGVSLYVESFGVLPYIDVYVLKLDVNGNLEWQKTFGGGNDDRAYSIQQTSDGGYIVAGHTYSFGAGGRNVYILKLDADGKTGPYPNE